MASGELMYKKCTWPVQILPIAYTPGKGVHWLLGVAVSVLGGMRQNPGYKALRAELARRVVEDVGHCGSGPQSKEVGNPAPLAAYAGPLGSSTSKVKCLSIFPKVGREEAEPSQRPQLLSIPQAGGKLPEGKEPMEKFCAFFCKWAYNAIGRAPLSAMRSQKHREWRFSMLNINFTRTFAKSILFFAAVSAQAQGLLWHQLAPGTYQVPGTLNTFVQSTYSCVLSMDQPVALPNGLLLNGPTIDFDSFLYQTFVYQAATDAQFVVSAYQCVLFRDADTISYANSLAALKSGMSRGQFIASVLNSAEYQSHIKPQLLLLH